MGLTTLSEVPSTHRVGDTLLFSVFYANFLPADGWSMAYTLRDDDDNVISLTSTTDNSMHLVSVAATTTASYLPGTYKGQGRATKTGATVTLWTGTLELLDDYTTAEQLDTRSWCKRCLDNIESVIEGRASKDVLNSTIAGQSVGRMTPEQLFALRDRFLSEYQAELAAERIGQGNASGNNVVYKFVQPL